MERGNVDLGDGELHDADGLERQAILHDDFENGGGVEDEPGEPELVAGDIDNVIERDRGGRAGGLLAMRRKRKRNVARQNQIQRFVLVFEIEQRDLVQLDHSTRDSLRPFAQAADRLIVHQQSVLLDRSQHLLAEILAAHVLRSLLRRNASENELGALSAVAVDRHAADFALVDRVDDARENKNFESGICAHELFEQACRRLHSRDIQIKNQQIGVFAVFGHQPSCVVCSRSCKDHRIRKLCFQE